MKNFIKYKEKHYGLYQTRVPKDRHAVLVLDLAPWHRCLKVPHNITLIHLPPYSPELNPHETVWEYLKNNFLSNKVFKDLNHIIETCCQAWNTLCQEKGRIKSIASRSWASTASKIDPPSAKLLTPLSGRKN